MLPKLVRRAALLLLLFLTICSAADDFYKILGVKRDAAQTDIKRAFRKKAVRWHPDKNPDKKEYAQKRMQRINEAYETLSDPEKRKIYDMGGAGQEQGGFSGGFPAGGFQGSGGFGGMDLNDILGDLMRGFGNQERGRRMKGGDMRFDFGDIGSMFGGGGSMGGGMGGRNCQTTTTCRGSSCTTRTVCT